MCEDSLYAEKQREVLSARCGPGPTARFTTLVHVFDVNAAMGEAEMQTGRPARTAHRRRLILLLTRIMALQRRRRMGVIEIAGLSIVSASTVHAVLVRVCLHRLAHAPVVSLWSCKAARAWGGW